ncbi:RnfABCDGE type electron transport complex subunit B [Proteiniclasticum sp. QWL-01]|uniref:RnfABCDGE type electron transport complex subunit B n=1 Tax=Proteiniclasticum sp. QWL-01 TaxID=3036945 RepID=UPI0024104E4C|nr:RnfABCDGE type electron transport complex subunit B [Proteiniclasticum sp. QWL-01]WFF72135.1 RnfABCDGE type electron transport complex subunit B [Proteiniclasticum sp. QWL-01]
MIASINFNSIGLPILVMGLTALILGVLITVVSKKFAVPVDTRVEDILLILPGANCGGCGYSGCSGYAEALASGSDGVTTKCIPGGPDTAESLSEYLGKSGGNFVPTVAQVYCQGTSQHTKPRYEYNGTKTCKAANLVQNGPGSCVYGCIGFGDCKTVCEYDAIEVIDGVARIIPENCVACGKCVLECPKNIIHLVPKVENAYINRCSNPLLGPIVKKTCGIGCIGCTLCVRACKYDAIKMKDSLAIIDQDKCVQCGECIKVCPSKSITMGLVM